MFLKRIRCGVSSDFTLSQVPSIGPPIPVLLDQPTGQQTREEGTVAGVPLRRMLCGNLMTELWDHVDFLCFIPDLFVTSAVRIRICM